jgi:hypothetical protein
MCRRPRYPLRAPPRARRHAQRNGAAHGWCRAPTAQSGAPACSPGDLHLRRPTAPALLSSRPPSSAAGLRGRSGPGVLVPAVPGPIRERPQERSLGAPHARAVRRTSTVRRLRSDPSPIASRRQWLAARSRAPPRSSRRCRPTGLVDPTVPRPSTARCRTSCSGPVGRRSRAGVSAFGARAARRRSSLRLHALRARDRGEFPHRARQPTHERLFRVRVRGHGRPTADGQAFRGLAAGAPSMPTVPCRSCRRRFAVLRLGKSASPSRRCRSAARHRRLPRRREQFRSGDEARLSSWWVVGHGRSRRRARRCIACGAAPRMLVAAPTGTITRARRRGRRSSPDQRQRPPPARRASNRCARSST